MEGEKSPRGMGAIMGGGGKFNCKGYGIRFIEGPSPTKLGKGASTPCADRESAFSTSHLLTAMLGMRHEYPHPCLCPSNYSLGAASWSVCQTISIGPSGITMLAHPLGHQDGALPSLCYHDGENLLVCRLPHPGGGLCHLLGQFLSLIQVKPLSGLLMVTKEQDS